MAPPAPDDTHVLDHLVVVGLLVMLRPTWSLHGCTPSGRNAMSETGMPSSLPVLGHGKHRDPARGACFMEYTSVLAGEAFSGAPVCVDPELAAVLRGANDLLADAQRPLLLPFLGRAIGLVVIAPDGRPDGRVLRGRP